MSPGTSKDLMAASATPIVLSILARGESYGYAIIQEVRERSGGELEWTEGMLYPVLHRLEGQGWIQARWRRSEAGRRRKYYRISTRGKVRLREERASWMIVHRTLDRFWRECRELVGSR